MARLAPGNHTRKIHGKSNGQYEASTFASKLNIESDDQVVNAVFHPEYTYGDFMGRLLPQTRGNAIEYKYRPGHFLIALAEAYRQRAESGSTGAPRNVLLVIDELNRGNAAAILGSTFNLLDRNDNGWSSYPVSLSNIEFEAFLRIMLPTAKEFNLTAAQVNLTGSFEDIRSHLKDASDTLLRIEKQANDKGDSKEVCRFTFKVKLPPNLYILSTINTSDESIYYMDSAFKRRWDWEYMNEDGNIVEIDNIEPPKWSVFRPKLNEFLKKNGSSIRRVEDKLLGPRFIRGTNVDEHGAICKQMTSRDLAKVMFHLWDSVFARDKKPLKTLLKMDDRDQLNTFGDFLNKAGDFVASCKTDSVG